MPSEVGLLDVFIGGEFGSGTFEDDGAGFEDVAMRCDGQRHVRILFDEEDGNAEILIDLDDLFEDRAHEDRRNTK